MYDEEKEFIKDIAFDTDYNISEDTIFINKVYERRLYHSRRIQ